jgi:hypothetical protein
MPNDQYGYPMPPEPPDARYGAAPPNAKGFAIASMVLGIVSIVFGVSGVFLITSLIGLILAITSRKYYQLAGLRPNGMGTAGLVLNIIGLVFNGIMVLACMVCAAAMPFMF